LQETGIEEKNIQIIHKLYWSQAAKLKLDHASQVDNIRIVRGIRQRCIIFSLLLFNICGENISAGT